jgi:hypothetical protein
MQMVPNGPKRHLVRRNDLVAIGGKADNARPLQSVATDPKLSIGGAFCCGAQYSTLAMRWGLVLGLRGWAMSRRGVHLFLGEVVHDPGLTLGDRSVDHRSPRRHKGATTPESWARYRLRGRGIDVQLENR